MKAKICLSRFSIILTAIICLALFIGCIATLHQEPTFFIVLSVYVVLLASVLFFGPAYIKADDEYLILGSICRKIKIPMRNIANAELFQPTMGAIRIIGSGGFVGYWGIFKEGDIGRYYAFYGKASDCILLRLKNGDKYVIGCQDPQLMLAYIKSRI